MRIIGKRGIISVATAAAAALVALACAEPGTSPVRDATVPGSANRGFDNTSINHTGLVQLCKQSTGKGAPRRMLSTFPGRRPTAGQASTSLTPGNCYTIVDNEGINTFTTITESATLPANWSFDSIHVSGGSAPDVGESISGNQVTVHSSNDRGRIVTYWNHYTAPTPTGGCTFTKGYYRNHPAAVTAIADLGLSLSQAQAILKATPGKPQGYTFTSNNLLNLAQQLISAIINGGQSGPQAAQDAISDAIAGITISGTSITTTLTQNGISSLIDTLSSFNEGSFAGFPHCGD